MADIRERYIRGQKSGNENYIGKGFLLLTTIAILILSLRRINFVVQMNSQRIMINNLIKMMIKKMIKQMIQIMVKILIY